MLTTMGAWAGGALKRLSKTGTALFAAAHGALELAYLDLAPGCVVNVHTHVPQPCAI